MSKRKSLPPKVKRMTREGRRASAVTWLPTYTGKNELRGYCNHFAVDWRCAAAELKLLGVNLDAAYLAQRERTEAETIRKRQEQKQHRDAKSSGRWHPYADPMAAYAAGDFAALHDLEHRQMAEDGERFDQADDSTDSVPF